jgi:hypothetical protein
VKLTYLKAPIQAAYSRAMAAAQRAQRVVRPASVEQAPSTEAILKRDPATDKEWQARPLDPNAQVRDALGKVFLNERPISLEEYSHVEAVRRRPKNTLGQAEGSSISSQKHWNATKAWLKDGCLLRQADLEGLRLLGQVSLITTLLEQSNTQEEFTKLMQDAGLRDVMMDLVNRGD